MLGKIYHTINIHAAAVVDTNNNIFTPSVQSWAAVPLLLLANLFVSYGGAMGIHVDALKKKLKGQHILISKWSHTDA